METAAGTDASNNANDVNRVSLNNGHETRPGSPHAGSDAEFDDNLAVPESLSIEGHDTHDSSTNGT